MPPLKPAITNNIGLFGDKHDGPEKRQKRVMTQYSRVPKSTKTATRASAPTNKKKAPPSSSQPAQTATAPPQPKRPTILKLDPIPIPPTTPPSLNKAASSPSSSSSSSPSGDASAPRSPPSTTTTLADEAATLLPSRCPICAAPVARHTLAEWQGGRPYMRIRAQMAFCASHRRAAARVAYAAGGYPAIDFDDDGGGGSSSLVARLEGFRPELLGVLRGERRSAFRDALGAEAARGAGRTLLAKAMAMAVRGEGEGEGGGLLRGLSVGYYGPRGRRVMEGWVARELAGDIREVAGGADGLVGYLTVGGFVQEVLVPELAARLVAEDLGVGEARAREVLAESAEVGELVNGVVEEKEEEDGRPVVVDHGDDDDGDY